MAKDIFSKVESLLPQALAADRRRVRRETNGLKRAKKKSLSGDNLEKKNHRFGKEIAGLS